MLKFEYCNAYISYDIPWNPAHLFPVYEGPVYHDFHYAKFKGTMRTFCLTLISI
jgi:4-alpha-methyl-delta7-sterol-4alpha-methyl oxidase